MPPDLVCRTDKYPASGYRSYPAGQDILVAARAATASPDAGAQVTVRLPAVAASPRCRRR